MSNAYFTGSSLEVLSLLRRTGGSEIDKAGQEAQRAVLVEHVVQIAALRALNAGRAAARARAAAEQSRRVADPALELLEAALGDPDAAGVTVVDEDGRKPGLGMDVRREPTDVPAVAHRPERQQRDQRVLRGVQRPEELRHLLEPGQVPCLRHEPDRLRREGRRWEL